MSFCVDLGQNMFPVCSFPHLFTHLRVRPCAACPSLPVPCYLALHEAIPVHIPTLPVLAGVTGEIDASTDMLSKSMIRARGPPPASRLNDGQSAVLFRAAPENRFQLGGP